MHQRLARAESNSRTRRDGRSLVIPSPTVIECSATICATRLRGEGTATSASRGERRCVFGSRCAPASSSRSSSPSESPAGPGCRGRHGRDAQSRLPRATDLEAPPRVAPHRMARTTNGTPVAPGLRQSAAPRLSMMTRCTLPPHGARIRTQTLAKRYAGTSQTQRPCANARSALCEFLARRPRTRSLRPQPCSAWRIAASCLIARMAPRRCACPRAKPSLQACLCLRRFGADRSGGHGLAHRPLFEWLEAPMLERRAPTAKYKVLIGG